jgi:hypothetical protein
MIDDDDTPPSKPIVGPDGEPLLGLQEKHRRVPPARQHASSSFSRFFVMLMAAPAYMPNAATTPGAHPDHGR